MGCQHPEMSCTYMYPMGDCVASQEAKFRYQAQFPGSKYKTAREYREKCDVTACRFYVPETGTVAVDLANRELKGVTHE